MVLCFAAAAMLSMALAPEVGVAGQAAVTAASADLGKVLLLPG